MDDSAVEKRGAETRDPFAGRAQLRLVGVSGRPLTKAQKRFDRLLRKVETLRGERTRATQRWDKFVKVYQERIHPEERRMLERRMQVVRILAAHRRKPKGLGKRQRELLELLLLVQLRALAEAGPEQFDAELREIWAELRPSRRGDAASEDEDEMKAAADTDAAENPFGDADAETDNASSTGPADATEAAEGDPSKSPRQSTAEKKAAEHAARREEARKRTVVGIYKQLAKVLHPDLERDPALRERKHTLMQELTKAYREGDLHTLLRLELEWIQREEGDLERLGEEKLGVYCELLEEQVADLQAEIRDLPYLPRFSAVARFVRLSGEGPGDPDSILLEIRRTSEGLKRFRDELNGPEARAALREALEVMAAQRREAERWSGFDEGF